MSYEEKYGNKPCEFCGRSFPYSELVEHEENCTMNRAKELNLNQPEDNWIEFCGVEEVLRISPEGFIYKGETIHDAGEAHKIFIEFFTKIRDAEAEE